MANTETRPWDVAEHLKTDEDMAAYLEAALEDGDPALVSAALGDIARARGVARLAQATGLARERLEALLAPDGASAFEAVLRLINALGLRLHAPAERR